MNFLVDTNVLSEATKPKPDPAVQAWLMEHETDVYISALTVGELKHGIERLPRGQRKDQLQLWLAKTCEMMDGRILSVNTSVASLWGLMCAKWAASGITMPTIDGLIAATAKRRGFTIVTRNDRDFARAGVRTLNPFSPRRRG